MKDGIISPQFVSHRGHRVFKKILCDLCGLFVLCELCGKQIYVFLYSEAAPKIKKASRDTMPFFIEDIQLIFSL
jgi:hypothetical protein